MKRREAMLAARGVAEVILAAAARRPVARTGPVTLTEEEAEQASAAALNVAEYLCVPRSE